MKGRVTKFKSFFNKDITGEYQEPKPSRKNPATNYYVAGVHIDVAFIGIDKNKKSSQELAALLTAKIPSIMADAKAECGDNAIVVIALCEYGLTLDIISLQDKKEILETLQETVNSYQNLLLVPGSFAVVTDYADPKKPNRLAKKVEKIQRNYQLLSGMEEINKDWIFTEEKHLMESADWKNKKVLQNSTYLMTAQTKKVQHKKSFPAYEHNHWVQDREESVFYPGVDNPLKQVKIGGKIMDVGISICRDVGCKLHLQELKQTPPLLHVIVSHTLDLRSGHCTGALTINMDYGYPSLSVRVNTKHYCAKEVGKVKAVKYFLDPNKEHENILISQFSEPLKPKTTALPAPRLLKP